MENVLYSAAVYPGTPRQGAATNTYIFDTTFKYTAIPSISCTSCLNAIYNVTASTSAVDLNTNVDTAYDFGVILGKSIKDTVCLSSTDTLSCADGLDFIDMTSPAESMTEVDGVIGLAPSDELDSGRNFVEQLASTQDYSKQVSFNLMDDEPYIYFGTPEADMQV